MALIDQEKARIFRITHIDNIEWAVRHGLHCRNSVTKDPNYKEIGNPDIPFYFTPYSPMLLNIKTGYLGLRKFRWKRSSFSSRVFRN